jgi:hypothetical protein
MGLGRGRPSAKTGREAVAWAIHIDEDGFVGEAVNKGSGLTGVWGCRAHEGVVIFGLLTLTQSTD